MTKQGSFKKITIAAIALLVVLVATCVAIAASGTAIETDATYYGVQVTTAGNINLNFYYTDLGSATEMVAEVYDPNGDLYDTINMPKADVTKVTVSDTELYCVRVPLTPAQMGYSVKVYAKDSAGKGATTEYSVLTYAQTILSSNDYSEYHNTMRALLNWGAMAQNVFGVSTDKLSNDGLYGRETNPIKNVGSFYSESGEVSNSANITGVEYALSLEPGTTAMHFYVKYTGTGTLSATVSKNGGEPVNTSVTEAFAKGEGVYRIRIANVGVAVYNTPYTITVTDGTETFTATKTVLENLNALAFANGENAKYNDIAKSMYQFYTLAMKQTPASCTHTNGLHMTAIGGNEYVTCSQCFTQVSARAVDKNIPWFTNPSEIRFSNTFTGGKAGKSELMYENGEPYARIGMLSDGTKASTGYILLTYDGDGKDVTPNLTDAGKYVVIKYRTNREVAAATIDLRVETDDRDYTVSSTQNSEAPKNGAWVTAVIDISSAATYGESGCAKVCFRTYNPNNFTYTVDIAYAAIVSSMEEARNLLLADETYKTCDISAYKDLMSKTSLNKEGRCASGCTISRLSAVNGDKTTYSYGCANCGYTMGNSHTVPSSLRFYSELNAVSRMDASDGKTYPTVVNVDEDDTAYIRSSAPATSEKEVFTRATQVTNGVQPTVTLGKYFVIKYRVSGGVLKHQTSIGGATQVKQDFAHKSADWQIVVVDISGFTGYEEGVAKTLWAEIRHTGVLDIAYTALAANMEDVRALLADGETYFYCGNSFANAGTEYNKEGRRVNGCTISQSATVNGDGTTTYSYKCANCGYTANSHTVPSSLRFYSKLGEIKRQDGSNAATIPGISVDKDGTAFVTSGTSVNGSSVYLRVTRVADGEVPTVKLGKYLVVKYRVSEGATALKNLTQIGGAARVEQDFAHKSSKWQIVVVDISGFTGYAEGEEKTLWTIIQCQGAVLDVAYTALAANMDDVRALLADGETYFDCGDSFANAGTEYNKDGSIVGGVVKLNKDLEGMITDKAENELQFLAFADVHTGLYAWNRIVEYYNYYGDYIDFALHAGDYAGGNLGLFVDLYGTGTKSNKPIFNAVGNHDTMPSDTNTAQAIGTAPKSEVFSKLFGTSGTWGVTFMEGENSMAYYIDYADKNIRFIVLDNYYDQDAQAIWLQGLLDDAKTKGMHVLTCMHQPSGAIVTPVNTNFQTTMPTSGFEYSAFDEILGNFIKNGGKFIANIAGHWHIDLFGYTENGVLNIAIETASPDKVPANQLDGRPQATGTRNYDAFDVITVNTTNGTFEIVRIGNNTDSASRTKTSLKFDYVNRKVLLENGEEKSNECETCTLKRTVTVNDDGTTTYAYICAVCGRKMANSHTVPSSILFYSELNQMGCWENGKGTKYPGISVDTDGTAYLKAPAPVTSGNEMFTRATQVSSASTSTTVKLGKYLVIKYRVSGGGTLKHQTSIGGAAQVKQDFAHKSADWQIVVVDISGFTGYAEGVAKTLDVQIRHTGVLDVAYTALAADMDDVRALLADGETYFYCGDSFANAGVEYNKDGSIPGESETETETTVEYTYYHSADDIAKMDGSGYITPVVDNSGDFSYVRFQRVDTSSVVAFYTTKYTETPKTGQYLIFKYRTDITTGWLAFKTSTQNTTGTNSNMHWTTLNGDGQWHVFIVDVSQSANSGNEFVADTNGEYAAKFLLMNLFYKTESTEKYMDFAYIAWADTADDAFAVVGEGEDISYGYYNGSTFVTLTK